MKTQPPHNKRNLFTIRSLHQKKIMEIIFIAASIPTLILGCGLYYVIFEIIELENTIPTNELTFLFSINKIILLLFPLSILLLWISAMIVTNRIVGGIDRITQDLKDRIEKDSNEPIQIRPKDEYKNLVSQINTLLTKRNTSKPGI